MVREATKPGDVFGDWTVVAFEGSDTYSQKRWYCRCTCGVTHVVYQLTLRSGSSRSCQVCSGLRRRIAHRRNDGPEYGSYMAMVARCLHPLSISYPDYGGRGISICAHWLGDDGYANFITDMGRRPGAGYSIERIDNDGPYTPSNCTWATRSAQQRNRRNTLFITAHRTTKPLSAWVEDRCLKYQTVYGRLSRGWTPERALELEDAA